MGDINLHLEDLELLESNDFALIAEQFGLVKRIVQLTHLLGGWLDVFIT